MTAASEWKRHWPLAAAATVGFSFPPTATFSLGLFMEPLSREFGWSRSDVTSGLIIVALLAIPFSAPMGALVDRFGTRRIAILGTALSVAAVAAFSLADGSIIQWLALWTFYSIASLFVKTTVWTASVSRAFHESRGLALGVVLCGVGISQTITPLVAQPLIDNFGWRHAYQVIAAGWGGLAMLLVLMLLHDVEGQRPSPNAGGQVVRDAVIGYSFREAVRTRSVQLICCAVLLGSLISVGVAVHLVPILGEAGMSRAAAAALASLAGGSAVAGKLLTGALLDRFRSNLIPCVSFALPGVAMAGLLIQPGPTFFVAMSTAILGYAGGATAQSTAYLVTRYAGLRSYGAIFGLISSLIGVAMGFGPWLAGKLFDLSGSYDLLLLIGTPVAFVAGTLLIGLGPYPAFASTPQQAPRRPKTSNAAESRPTTQHN